MDSDDVAMFDAEVVADNTVNPSTAVVKVVIRQNNQHSVLPLLAAYQNGIATEKLELLHSVLRKCNDGVVIVYCISNPAFPVSTFKPESLPEVSAT